MGKTLSVLMDLKMAHKMSTNSPTRAKVKIQTVS